MIAAYFDEPVIPSILFFGSILLMMGTMLLFEGIGKTAGSAAEIHPEPFWNGRMPATPGQLSGHGLLELSGSVVLRCRGSECVQNPCTPA